MDRFMFPRHYWPKKRGPGPSATPGSPQAGPGATEQWVRPLQRLTLVLLGAVVLSLAALGVRAALDRGGSTGGDLLDYEVTRLEASVRASPGDPVARLALATAYEARSRYSDAVKQYRVALEIQPDLAGALIGLGRTQLAMGRADQAAATFQQVIDQRSGAEFAGVDPDLAEAYYYLGRVRLDQGDATGAVEVLRQAVAIEPAVADDWLLLGRALQATGDDTGAVEAARRAVRLAPDMGEAYALLLSIYEPAGREAEAAYARGMLAYAEGRLEEAEQELNDALARSPRLWEAMAGLGLTQEKQGRREEALASYRRALAGDPDNMAAQAGAARLGGGR